LTIVLDSNVVVALALDVKRAPAIEQRLREWEDAGEALHAPSLYRFEVANALTRSIVAGAIDSSDAKSAWQQIVAIEVSLHGLKDGPAVVAVAQKLKRESAYDAAYVVLAQELGADLWTLDGPLARNAAGAGLPVQLIDTA
jgi:predicted nucleic acid-binding protein